MIYKLLSNRLRAKRALLTLKAVEPMLVMRVEIYIEELERELKQYKNIVNSSEAGGEY